MLSKKRLKKNHIMILAGLLLFALSACTKDKSKPAAAPGAARHIIVSGDPLELLADTKMDGEVDLDFFRSSPNATLYLGLNNLYHESVEYVEPEKNQQESLTKRAAGLSSVPEFDLPELQVKVVDSTEVRIDQSERYGFGIRRLKDGKYEYSLYQRKSTFVGQVLHFSKSRDGNFASLAVTFRDVDGGVLQHLVFARTWKPVKPQVLPQPFKYMKGPGVVMRWPGRSVDLEVCGKTKRATLGLVKQSVHEWNQALNGLFKIELVETESCAPFTDLNRHGIYFLENFRIFDDETAPEDIITGFTSVLFDLVGQKIFDADIFISAEGLSRRAADEPFKVGLETSQRIASHELGHFLGLGHPFTGDADADAKLPDAVMAYKSDIICVQPYDAEAIRALYAKGLGY